MNIDRHKIADRTLQRSKRILLQPVGFGVVLLCVVWAAVWQHIETERKAAERDIDQEAANLAQVFEKNISRTASEIDRILKFLRQSYERSGFTAEWPGLLQEDFTVDEKTVQMAVMDPKGMMITSTAMLYPPKPVDLSDREHFRVHAESDLDTLFISKPVVGRASGKWSVQFTRRYYAKDGGFGGVVVLSLDPTYLSSAYGGLNLGRGTGVAVVGPDDIVRTGTGIYADSLGQKLHDITSFNDVKRDDDGTRLVNAHIGGHERVMAIRPVKDYPLKVVVAGRDIMEDGPRQSNRRKYVAGATFLSILVLFAVIGALRSRIRHEAELLHIARHDHLTGLANRAKFSEGIDRAFESFQDGREFALHLIDLDGFKFVNDTRGHPLGDRLLTHVADRLQAALGPQDSVARLGGDEFAVIQADVREEADAAELAKLMCQILSEPYDIEGLRVIVGASIGVALGHKHARTAADLVKAADLALYAAKAAGRGRFCFYNKSMHASVQARHALETSLRVALEGNQLEVHYQPIVNIASKELKGFEALVRWRHPERGLVSPAEFISVAEETGLIVPIGAWVLQTACMEMANRPDTLKIAVNIAPSQFRDGTLVDTVRSALEASGLAPHRLEIEITESTLMQHDSTTIGQLQELQALGIRIVLDDFGTGYSSLSYLQMYPISRIKIDRSFVKTLGQKHSATVIIRAITTLASNLGMSTVAEGVETQQQLDELAVLGCTEAQGYFFSPPKPADEILPEKVSEDGRRSLAA
jgi:diguanylate cyclase (GGDEF)-like protein